MTNYPAMKMEPHEYDSYGLVVPKMTHTRPATCEEVVTVCTSIVGQTSDGVPVQCEHAHCGPWAHGWKTMVDLSTDLGQRQARYIRDQSGRHFTVEREGDTSVTLTFPAGQQCFNEHRLPLDRPPLFTIKHGDFRTYGRPRVTDVSEWVDRFATNQDVIKTIKDRG